MKICLLLLLAGTCAFAYDYPAGSGGFYGQAFAYGKTQVADKPFLQKQLAILRLFKYVNQPYYYYKEWYDVVKDYSIENSVSYYTNQTAVKQFVYYYRQGLLPRGEIFSPFYNYQLQQAISLFNVFYYAQDFETFYKTAVYLRGKVNEGMYLYALSVAIYHRADTYGIVIPPIYEVYPYYFYNSEVLQKAYQYKQQYYGKQSGEYYIYANYSGWYSNVNPEQYLSYYTEDVGINAYYYYYNLYYPFWMSGEQYGLKYDYRGELYYYTYQQLLARYYLERLSNGYGQIPSVDFDVPYPYGYSSSLIYPNGYVFPSRPAFARLSDYFYNYGQYSALSNQYVNSYSYVYDYERRIMDAISSGFVYSKSGEKIDIYADPEQGFNILGNIIEGNADSVNPRYYGSIQVFARHLLGYSYQPYSPYQIAPSALEQFETSLRDPAFYSFYKKIVYFFQTYKSYLQPYSYNDLYFPGVKVQNVEFDRLVTYFDFFESDITNALYVNPQEYERVYESSDYFSVKVRQQRLNYKPFSYKIYVDAEQPVESVVRVYIGPKYDEYGRPYDINENRANFVLFDFFKYSLQSGSNVIDRNSRQNYWYAPDRTSFQYLYSKVNAALKGDEEFVLDGSEAYYGFPQRYLLPKGKYGGYPYQFYVIVSPYKPYSNYQHPDSFEYYYPRVGTGTLYYDQYPLGYPFDRVIDEYSFFVPNSYFYETNIYFRDYEDVNSSYQEVQGEQYPSYSSYPKSSYPQYSQYQKQYSKYPYSAKYYQGQYQEKYPTQ